MGRATSTYYEKTRMDKRGIMYEYNLTCINEEGNTYHIICNRPINNINNHSNTIQLHIWRGASWKWSLPINFCTDDYIDYFKFSFLLFFFIIAI